MPYHIEKQKGKFAIVNEKTGKVVGKSKTRENAKSSIRARMRAERHK